MNSREAFEAGPGDELSLARRADGTYISVTTELAWESWKTATQRAATICADRALKWSGTRSKWQHFQGAATGASVCADDILKGNY